MDKINLLKKLWGYISSNCEYIFPVEEFQELVKSNYEQEIEIHEKNKCLDRVLRFVSKNGLLWISQYMILGADMRMSTDTIVCVYISQIGTLSKGIIAPKGVLFKSSDIEAQSRFQLAHQTRQ